MEDQHPYQGYNKLENKSTILVGNWQEEQALADLTGVTRYATQDFPAATTFEGNETITKMVEMQTHTRTIEHTRAQIHPNDWASTTHVMHAAPKDQKSLALHKGLAAMGPRERAEYAAMVQEANAVPDAELFRVTGYPIPHDLTTTQRASYQGHDVTQQTDSRGARVMRNHDGVPATRDPTFLSETMHMFSQKEKVDRLYPNAKDLGASATQVLPDADIPVTLYTEAVAGKTYGGTFQGSQTVNPKVPFGRYTNFSKPMGEYDKVVVDE